MAEWQRARLIPVTGIGSEREAETRATSALLAVIEAVRDLSVGLFAPLGASRAQKADVRCFTEVPFKIGNSKKASRPDGLVQVTYGKSTWTALIEVKTGTAVLEAEQVNAYWDVARDQQFDAVITISNEIAPSPSAHPTEGLKVRSNSRVQVHHYSWAALLTMCEVIQDHRGVDDPDQAWILGELIRYIRHPSSGASALEDMGGEWVAVRDGARDRTLRRSDASIKETAVRWDQLLRFAALRLEAGIGATVTQFLPTAQREAAKRTQYLTERLVADGQLDGVLRVPKTAGDLEVSADLRSRRISAAVSVAAPDDRGGKARCTWLANQLRSDVDDKLIIEAYPKNARTPTTVSLSQLREDKDSLLGEDRRDPVRFRLILTREMGVARKTGRTSQGFIDSVLGLITDFYEGLVQDLVVWSPKAPRVVRAKAPTEDGPVGASPHAPPDPQPLTFDEPPIDLRDETVAPIPADGEMQMGDAAVDIDLSADQPEALGAEPL